MAFITTACMVSPEIIAKTRKRVIQKTKIGVPNLSIQIVVMLICLLMSNSEAKSQFKRRLPSIRKEALPIQQQISNTNQETRNHAVNFHTKSKSPRNDQIILNQKTINTTEENTNIKNPNTSITGHK